MAPPVQLRQLLALMGGGLAAQWLRRMKLLSKDDQKVVFQLSQREKQTLLALLRRYPVLKTDFQTLTKQGDAAVLHEDQELLAQSLAEQKEENRKFMAALLKNPDRFKATGATWRLCLEAAEVEWFLQILNDLRVGYWYRAGCPDEQSGRKLDLTSDNLENLWVMEVAGAFQWQIIEAMDSFGY